MVEFKFSLDTAATAATYTVLFDLDVWVCDLIIPPLSSTSSSDTLPISTNLDVQWSPWSYELPSDCTFDTYQVTLTDPNGKELVF